MSTTSVDEFGGYEKPLDRENVLRHAPDFVAMVRSEICKILTTWGRSMGFNPRRIGDSDDDILHKVLSLMEADKSGNLSMEGGGDGAVNEEYIRKKVGRALARLNRKSGRIDPEDVGSIGASDVEEARRAFQSAVTRAYKEIAEEAGEGRESDAEVTILVLLIRSYAREMWLQCTDPSTRKKLLEQARTRDASITTEEELFEAIEKAAGMGVEDLLAHVTSDLDNGVLPLNEYEKAAAEAVSVAYFNMFR